MKSTPLIMSGPMTRAYLAGFKTEIRRTGRMEKINSDPGAWFLVPDIDREYHPDTFAFMRKNVLPKEVITIKSPYGGPGDEVWIKENYRCENKYDHLKPGDLPKEIPVWYAADEIGPVLILGKLRPAVFMPRWASRFPHVPLLSCLPMRVQDITEAGARAEGFAPNNDADNGSDYTRWPPARYYFKLYWDLLKGEKPGLAWDDNPWVWVLKIQGAGK